MGRSIIKKNFNRKLYTSQAIVKAAALFKEAAEIKINKNNKYFLVSLNVSVDMGEILADEFTNAVLAYTHKQLI